MNGETREQRATRRRWINLAELVAVASVMIAALSLWLTWSGQRQADADRRVTAAMQAHDKARFFPHASVTDGGRSVTLAGDADHDLRDIKVAFPTALGVGAQDAIGHAIDRDWFAAPLLKLAESGAQRVGRLPVLVTFTYSAGDDELTRAALYDLVWETNGRFLRGRTLSITGVRLHEHGGDQKRLDALWAADQPR